jgi:hypothetical protein
VPSVVATASMTARQAGEIRVAGKVVVMVHLLSMSAARSLRTSPMMATATR